jgi:hypothetical protein
MTSSISLSLSIKKKQQNVLFINGYMQTDTSKIHMDILDHIKPVQLDHLVIQKNYKTLKNMFTPNPILIKSIPFCLYDIPIWHANTSKDTTIFYTKLFINRWICTIVVKPCVFDFVCFEKYKTATQTIYTDYDMCIIVKNDVDDANDAEIIECGYITEKNPIDI